MQALPGADGRARIQVLFADSKHKENKYVYSYKGDETNGECHDHAGRRQGRAVRRNRPRQAAECRRAADDASDDPANARCVSQRNRAPGGGVAGRTPATNAASQSNFRESSAKSCRASTKCWTPSCCPSAKATAFWHKSPAGKIDELITQTYKGDHEKMKQAVNNVAVVVQSLQKEMARLTDASRDGQLSERGKPEQFQGAYAEIVRGVNTMLDAILLPIGEGNRILAQISSGKIDELIAQTYKGDHEKMKQAVNNVAIVLQSLQKELVRLTEASKEGQLSERGKPDQFQGAYAEIVRGINTMLDAILLPIGEGNRILAQISNGKIDELIAQTYKGDHEKMKQAVNNVAIVLQSLQKELVRLTDASKEGQLSERGKPEQFQGAYAEIVRGVNAMLDAILLPIGEGNRILAQISTGKIDELIAQTYKGDHEKMKQAVNNVGSGPARPQKELVRLTEASQCGQLIRARQARTVPGRLCRHRARRECDSRRGHHPSECRGQLCRSHQQGRHSLRKSPTPITATSMPSRTI